MENNNKGLPGGAWIAIISISVAALLILIGIATQLYRSTSRLEHDLAAKDETSDGEDTPDGPAISPLTFSEKFGLGGMLSLCIPVPLVIASLGFLSSFWAMPTEPKSSILQNWLLGNKMPRIITVTSLILRSGALGQTALGISMIASLALEKFLVRTRDIPTLMIQRSNKGATFDLLLLFVKRLFEPSNQRPVWLLFPLLLLMTTSFGLQFTSTILLLDLGDGNVPSPPITTPISLGYLSSSIAQRGRSNNDVNYAGSPPLAYPPFAELTSSTPQRHEAIDYTGVSLRAFLPFTSQAALLSLRKFSGPTTLINTTTLCVRPPIQTVSLVPVSDPYSLMMNVTFDRPTFEQQLREKGFDAGYFFDDRFSDPGNRNQYSPFVTSQDFDGDFSCTIAPCFLDPGEDGCKEYPIHMCSLGGVRAFAFIQENILTTDIRKLQNWWENMNTSQITTYTENEWMVVNITTVELKVSLCSTILEPQYQLVNISSDSPLTERILATDNSTQTPDPTDLLEWLGVSHQSMKLGHRGILTLEEPNWFSKGGYQPKRGFIAGPLSGNPMGQYYKDKSTTYRICFLCSGDATDGLAYLHPVHTALVQRSLKNSGPAKALQAFWTLVYQSYYYDTLQFFNYFDNGTYNSWVPVLVPVRYGGFVAVCCMAITHLLVVFCISVVFVRQTRFSKLHDPWLAYTQAWNGEFADLLDEVTRRGIEDPSRFLKRRDRGEEMVGLGPDVLERAVGIRKRRTKLLDDMGSSDESD